MILLDTHVWVWWMTDEQRLTRAMRQAIAFADDVAISAISGLEIANLVRKDRLQLDLPVERWITDATRRLRAQVLPVSLEIAVRAGSMTWDHGDPADRILVSTASLHDIPLVTADRKIVSAGFVDVIG